MTGATDRARARLLAGELQAVPDEALLAVVLGAPDDSTARRVFEDHPAPDRFWRICAEDLVGYPGVGRSAAARVVACLELSRRAGRWRAGERLFVSSPEDVCEQIAPRVRGADREHFFVIALGTRNQLLKVWEVSVGSLSASIVHPRELFREAVRCAAASVVVAHNHPSGDPTPSGADIQLTRRLLKAGDVLGIEVLDHVVVGDGGAWESMRERGLM
jgi:DNA repair protein RadC